VVQLQDKSKRHSCSVIYFQVGSLSETLPLKKERLSKPEIKSYSKPKGLTRLLALFIWNFSPA